MTKKLDANNIDDITFTIKITVIRFCSLRYKSFVMPSWLQIIIKGYQLKTIAARGVDFEVGAKLFQTSDP